MSAVSLARNRSRESDIRDHLLACEAAFNPPLSLRVSIEDYALRIAAHAERFEAWAGPDLIGLAALYCNAEPREGSFLTNLSVVPARMREGIGRRLLDQAIAHARAVGFSRMSLSVDRHAPALGLYRALGFAGEALPDGGLSLSLDLSQETRPRQEIRP